MPTNDNPTALDAPRFTVERLGDVPDGARVAPFLLDSAARMACHMADLIVTVPKGIYLDWIAEGDAAGEPSTGEEWGWYMGGPRPPMVPGDRLYVCAWGRLRGYAPIVRVVQTERGWCICRRGDAVAVTITETIPGFRGWRRPWWSASDERPFPAWRTEDVDIGKAAGGLWPAAIGGAR